jgi:hypothetical protein
MGIHVLFSSSIIELVATIHRVRKKRNPYTRRTALHGNANRSSEVLAAWLPGDGAAPGAIAGTTLDALVVGSYYPSHHPDEWMKPLILPFEPPLSR